MIGRRQRARRLMLRQKPLRALGMPSSSIVSEGPRLLKIPLPYARPGSLCFGLESSIRSLAVAGPVQSESILNKPASNVGSCLLDCNALLPGGCGHGRRRCK
jgi:hypothetical protein